MLDIAQPALRKATPEDAGLLRQCFEYASEGLAPHFWAQSLEPGQTLTEVAEARMVAKITDPVQRIWIAGDSLGAVVGYPIGDQPETVDGLPSVIRPLVELENQALGTYYINMLAVLPEARRMGLGRAMIAQARADADGRRLSLIVSDENAVARALYRVAGLEEVADAPQVGDGWRPAGERWILMIETD